MTPSDISAPNGTLAERVSYLIGLHFGGSVNAAATEFHLPQRTLARIAKGQSTSPPSQTLARIAEGFGVSVDWLLTGRGEPPPGPRPLQNMPPGRWMSAWYRWLDHLKLPALEHRLLYEQPVNSWVVAQALEAALQTTDLSHDPPKRCAELLEDVCRAWTRYMSELEGDVGAKKLREAIVDHDPTLYAFGGGTVGQFLSQTKDPKLEEAARDLFTLADVEVFPEQVYDAERAAGTLLDYAKRYRESHEKGRPSSGKKRPAAKNRQRGRR